MNEIDELLNDDWLLPRFVPLTKGAIAVVDAWAYDAIVSMGAWRSYNGYAIIGSNGENILGMHRAVLMLAGHDLGDLEVDHWNGDKADNRLSNLRPATTALNQIARGRLPNNASGYIGVTECKARSKWMAYIKDAEHGRIHLGMFADKIEAARARDVEALRLYGHWPKLNFPLDLPYEYQGPPAVSRPPFESLTKVYKRQPRHHR